MRGTLCCFKIVLFRSPFSLGTEASLVWFIGPGFKNRPSIGFKVAFAIWFFGIGLLLVVQEYCS